MALIFHHFSQPFRTFASHNFFPTIFPTFPAVVRSHGPSAQAGPRPSHRCLQKDHSGGLCAANIGAPWASAAGAGGWDRQGFWGSLMFVAICDMWNHSFLVIELCCTIDYCSILSYINIYYHIIIIIILHLFHWLLNFVSSTRGSPGWGPQFNVIFSGVQPPWQHKGLLKL